MDTLRIPVTQEEAKVSVEPRIKSRVRVSTRTHEIEDRIAATLESSDVRVKRVPINEFVDAAPEVRRDGDITIVPVVEEVLVVEKRLVLKEELHIQSIRAAETVEVPVVLRKQEATVERIDDPIQETK